ncbi:487_t:CDS:1, partial [Gigaspora rosea]
TAISKHDTKSTLIQQTTIPNITPAMNDANDVESTNMDVTNDERQSTNQQRKTKHQPMAKETPTLKEKKNKR